MSDAKDATLQIRLPSSLLQRLERWRENFVRVKDVDISLAEAARRVMDLGLAVENYRGRDKEHVRK